jgi:two-component system OmpR family sensor kinase
MPRTLYAKLAVVLVLLLASIGALYALLSVSAAGHYVQSVNQQLNHDLAKNLVADRNLVEQGRINEAALKETFHQYMVINPSIEIYLLDLQGNILSYSADPTKVKRHHVSLEPIKAFLNSKSPELLLGDDPRSHDRQKIFSVTTVPSAESPQGYLYVVLRGEQFDETERMVRESFLLRLSGWALGASLLFGLLTGLLIFHLLTRRLRRLNAAMEDFRRDDFTQPLTTVANLRADTRGDEVDQLAATFDAMARHISHLLEDIRHQDTLRRDMVANISHDLRTPLASLHGYLETLQLKGESLDEATRAQYLDTAIRSSKRLTRLVSELFELAKLEQAETAPHLEAFSLGELAHDVMQKFHIQATEKHIDFQADVPPDLPFVAADIGMIERVLDNLLANAIRSTADGGRITVALRAQDGGVQVTVADNGAGITADQLPHIFERFYRADNAHRDGESAGLGLAIVKRILELHHTTIEVTSRPGEGATFSFWLKSPESVSR